MISGTATEVIENLCSIFCQNFARSTTNLDTCLILVEDSSTIIETVCHHLIVDQTSFCIPLSGNKVIYKQNLPPLADLHGGPQRQIVSDSKVSGKKPIWEVTIVSIWR